MKSEVQAIVKCSSARPAGRAFEEVIVSAWSERAHVLYTRPIERVETDPACGRAAHPQQRWAPQPRDLR